MQDFIMHCSLIAAKTSSHRHHFLNYNNLTQTNIIFSATTNDGQSTRPTFLQIQYISTLIAVICDLRLQLKSGRQDAIYMYKKCTAM